MEKRLPLALFLSFLVLVGWRALFPPPVPGPVERSDNAAAVREPAAGVATEGVADDDGAQGGAALDDATEPLGEVVVAEREETTALEFGTPGERGSFRIEFTNRGGRIRRLWLGDHFDQTGLSDEEKRDRSHWVTLLDAVPLGPPAGAADAADEPRTASFGLRTTPSSQAYTAGPLDEALWEMSVLGAPDAPEGVEFRYAPGRGVTFVKRFRPVPGTHELELVLELHNVAAETSGPAMFLLTPAACVPTESGDPFYREPQVIAAGREGTKDVDPTGKDPEPRAKPDERRGSLNVRGDLVFAGVHNKYFAVLLHAPDPQSAPTLRGAEWRAVFDGDYVRENPTKAFEAWRLLATDVILGLQVPPPGESRSWTYHAYCGPKDREELEAVDPSFAALVSKDLGFFDGIARLLLIVLGFFQGIVGNWGVAIILLTVTVRLLLFPVNRRSQTAMARYQKKMKRVQPKIEALKEKHGKDAQRLRQEQAKLMQEEQAFPPLGGCLPVFVQIPIFFGLFSALRTSFDLRQAPFVGWIDDLSKPDRLLTLNFDTHLPLIGTIEYLNILPPLMVVLWVLQQRMMPAPADEQAARMQKMMMWMPVMMGFFLYNYAAGLSVYMITTSFFGIIEMGYIKKRWPIDDTELEPKPRSGFMQKLAAAQKEQVRRLEEQRRTGGGTRPRGGGAKKKQRY